MAAIVLAACLALTGPAAAAPASAPAVGWDYDLVLRPDGHTLDVTLCFRGYVPRTLQVLESGAIGALALRPHPDGTPSFRPGARGVITVAGLERHRCLSYTVDLARLAGEVGGDLGGAYLLNPALFLLRPTRWPRGGETITLAVRTPEGLDAALPWPRARGRDGTPGRYLLERTAFQPRGRALIGEVERIDAVIAKSEFRIAIAPGRRTASREGIERWIRAAGEAVADLYGRFPVSPVLVVVTTSRPSREPVVFGQSLRSGGEVVQLYLAANARDEDLPGEWVAVHELMHLGMPWIQEQDVWLSEGFVTYYQEVLRARAGFFDERVGWNHLHQGFGRGRRVQTGRSLLEDSRSMHRTHAYHRVYWGGAALALSADLAIRQRSGGTRSLDDVIRFWWRTYGNSKRLHGGRDLLRAADRHLGLDACCGLADHFLAQAAFPSLVREYDALGLAVAGREVTYRDEGAQIEERTRIMRPGGR